MRAHTKVVLYAVVCAWVATVAGALAAGHRNSAWGPVAGISGTQAVIAIIAALFIWIASK